jgi:L-ribulose-5-phosphate 3-epimerase
VPQNPISFMTANFVARETGYAMDDGWMQGDAATQAAFSPVETFQERFDEILAEVTDLGFHAIDLWSAHLNGTWATDGHIAAARELLDRRSLPVLSLGGGLGGTLPEFDGFCRIARGLACPLLGGRTELLDTEREAVLDLLGRHGLRLGIENHPEPTPAQVLEQIGDDTEVLGTVIDTGWWATMGYDPIQAIADLAPHIVHVHLKDVRHAGYPHETCKWGEGIVPVEGCVRKLMEIRYTGGLEIEHEPEHEDPSEACREMLGMLERWLEQHGR